MKMDKEVIYDADKNTCWTNIQSGVGRSTCAVVATIYLQQGEIL